MSTSRLIITQNMIKSEEEKSPFVDMTDIEWKNLVNLSQTLRKTLESTYDSTVTYALSTLVKLSNIEKIRTHLTHPKLQLLPILTHCIINGPGIIIRYSLQSIWYLSRSKVNDVLIADPKLGLVPVVVELLRNRNDEMAYKILRNCSFHPENHKYLLSLEIGYLKYWKDVIHLNPFSPDPYDVLGSIVSTINSENIERILELRLHEIVMNRLISAGTNPSIWLGRDCGIEDHALSFLTHISSLHQGSAALFGLNPLEFLLQVSSLDTIEGVRCFLLLINIFGTNSSFCDASSFTSHQLFPCSLCSSMYLDTNRILPTFTRKQITLSHVDSLIVILLGMISNPGEHDFLRVGLYGYEHGMLMLRDVLSFFRNYFYLFPDFSFQFILNDKDTRIFSAMVKIFHRFIAEEEDFSCPNEVASINSGGGIDDLLSIELLFEILILLFVHSSSSIMRRAELFVSVDDFHLLDCVKDVLSKNIIESNENIRRLGQFILDNFANSQ